MSSSTDLSVDGRTLVVRVPITVAKRGGRKAIVVPDMLIAPRNRGKVDSALVKALARAFRWRKLIETSAYGTISELASAEKINPSYVSRSLRMTLLAPELVESILDGIAPRHQLTVGDLMRPFPAKWSRQFTDGRAGLDH